MARGGGGVVVIRRLGDGTLEVVAPYDPGFPSLAREIDGTWDREARVWRFAGADERHVRRLVNIFYPNAAVRTETAGGGG